MNKSILVLLIAGITGAASLGIGEAYAESVPGINVQNIQMIAMASTVIGALVAVGAKAVNLPAGQSFSLKKALSAIITSVTTSFTMVNLGLIPQETQGMTLFGIVIMYFILGYGTDRGLSKLDK